MLTIEAYIARRKAEDGLNEFDLNECAGNTKICVNYIFEYFNNYLTMSKEEERTALNDERLNKYRGRFTGYNKEIVDWLVDIYSEHGNYLDQHIRSIISWNEHYFYLYNTDSEFRSTSYECYAELIKKFPYLKNQTEMLFRYIKEYHRVTSEENHNVFIIAELEDWIETTWEKHHVNLYLFAHTWCYYFDQNKDIWPKGTKIKREGLSFEHYDYDYKQKRNLFNIDSLYRNMPKKPYTKGRKQEFEILMMYYWLNNAWPNKDYWEEYLEKTLPSLKKRNILFSDD